jgi:hypothetical protein
MTTEPAAWGQKAQVEHTWAFAVDQLAPGTYALTVGRDTSLVDRRGLEEFLQEQLGVQHDEELGGGHVG